MSFFFNIVFYPIVFIIIAVVFFYEPVATSIFLCVFLTVCVVLGILLRKQIKRR